MKDDKQDKRLLTMAEAAERLGFDVKQMRSRVDVGRIKFTAKEGGEYLFSEEDLRQYARVKWRKENRLLVALGVALCVMLCAAGLYEGYVLYKAARCRKEMRAAEAFIKRGDLKSALVMYRKAAADDAGNAGAALGYAKLLCRGGMRDECEGQLRRAMKIDGGSADVKQSLAILLIGKGNNDEAEGLLRDILRAEPDHFAANYYLAAVLARKGKYAEAKRRIDRVLKVRADFAPAEMVMADIFVGENKLGEAADIYGRNADRNLVALLNKGVLLQKGGRDAEARAVYEEVAANSPVVARAFNNLAWGMVAGEERPSKETLERAFTYARQALLLNPRDATAADTMGWVLFLAGKDKEAETSLRAAVKLDAGLSVGHFHLARLLLKQKRNAEALQSLEAAKKSLKPNDEISRETLDMFIEKARMQKEKKK